MPEYVRGKFRLLILIAPSWMEDPWISTWITSNVGMNGWIGVMEVY